MGNKLNEILELCIEKSKDNVFYIFIYNPVLKEVTIDKFKKPDDFTTNHFLDNEIDKALEYIQNE